MLLTYKPLCKEGKVDGKYKGCPLECHYGESEKMTQEARVNGNLEHGGWREVDGKEVYVPW